ncbi:MAG: cadherin domain-containing protein, partial [Planctomycetaceae bacterium]|nr:cadherin domain-containing protein [Planctomycetaceae bacterium]
LFVDETGQYEFSGLPDGNYAVREVVPAGYGIAYPASPWNVAVVGGQVATDVDFGNILLPSVTLDNTVTSLPEDTNTTLRIRVADIAIRLEQSPFVNQLLTGPDAALFQIVGTQLFLRAGVKLDFETKPLLEVTVNIDDPSIGTGPEDSETLQIMVTDVNELPVLTGGTFAIPEHSANGTVVGSVSATDPDVPVQELTFSIVAGNTNGAFAIDPMSGEITVADTTKVDFETQTSFVLVVQVEDDGVPPNQVTTPVRVNLSNINERPTVQDDTFFLDERSPVDTVVGALQVADIDANSEFTYSILSGNTGDAFAIDASGNIVVNDAAPLLFAVNPVFTLTVEVTDNGSPQLSDMATITINLNDLNEIPRVDDATFNIVENLANDSVIGSATGTDDDGTITNWAIVGGNVGNAFKIDATTGEITVNNTSAVNFEVTPTFSLTIEGTDNAGDAGTGTVTIHLSDIEEHGVLLYDQSTGRWVYGASDGQRFRANSAPRLLSADGWHPYTGDFNGDGVSDLAGRTSTGVWVISLNQSGEYQSSVWGTWEADATAGWNLVHVADFTGDGLDDIVGLNNNGDWQLAESTGSGFVMSVIGHLSNGNWVTHQFGDFTGDGRTDIASLNATGMWWLHESTATGLVSTRWVRVASQADSGWENFAVGDFNGDGMDDLVAQQALKLGQWWQAFSDGTRFFMQYANRWDAGTMTEMLVGDFNDDGRDDFAARREDGVWQVNLAQISGRMNRRAVGRWGTETGWQAVIGDFNGDGLDDIAGIQAATGQWWLFTSQGNTFRRDYFGTWGSINTPSHLGYVN